jgi:hypothetical protein
MDAGGQHKPSGATAFAKPQYRHADPRSSHHCDTTDIDLCQERRMVSNRVIAMQAAEHALRALQVPSALPVLWAVQRHAAALPAAASARLLLAEKLSAHLFLHEDIRSACCSCAAYLFAAFPASRSTSYCQSQKGRKTRRRSTRRAARSGVGPSVLSVLRLLQVQRVQRPCGNCPSRSMQVRSNRARRSNCTL